MPPTVNPAVMHNVQKLKQEVLKARNERRGAFITAVRLVPKSRTAPSPQEAHDLDVAIERFFAVASHCHDLAQKFSNLSMLLELVQEVEE